MSEDTKFGYGFVLNVSRSGGEPSIFGHRFFPDQILALDPSPSGGANVTVECADGAKLTVPVTQSIANIEHLIARCRELDKALAQP